jgi:hypothetical protein
VSERDVIDVYRIHRRQKEERRTFLTACILQKSSVHFISHTKLNFSIFQTYIYIYITVNNVTRCVTFAVLNPCLKYWKIHTYIHTYIHMGPKKCTNSLIVNIFGTKRRVVTILARYCSVMFAHLHMCHVNVVPRGRCEQWTAATMAERSKWYWKYENSKEVQRQWQNEFGTHVCVCVSYLFIYAQSNQWNFMAPEVFFLSNHESRLTCTQ